MKRNHILLALIAVIIILNVDHSLAAVTLASFTAAGSDGQVVLEWETASEVDNIGFYLWRSTSQTGSRIQLNNALLIPSQSPGSVIGAYYSYADSSNVVNGTTYYYWLDSIDTSGRSDRHGPISVTPEGQTAATPTATPTSPWTATPIATTTATATLPPPPTATRTPTPPPTATRTTTTTPPTLPTATSIMTAAYPPLPTATSISTTPYPPLPTATIPLEPTSTPTSTPTALPTWTPMAISPPTVTPATTESSSPTSTVAAATTVTVTLVPTPTLDKTPASGSTEPTVETQVESPKTPSPTGPSTSVPLTPAATPQPPVATASPTALGLSEGTPTPAVALAARPISRDPEGLGDLWLVGLLLVALGAGGAWLAYLLLRKGR